MSGPLAYTIVIATYERPDALRDALASVARQTRRPASVIVVDASASDATQTQTEQVTLTCALPAVYRRAERPSAAVQRNQGSREVATPLIAFMDDDVVLAPDVFEKLCAVFESQRDTGGVAARMNGIVHPAPRGLLWWYYRIQAGYRDATYAARVFGPGLNTYPSYENTHGDLIPAEWLNLGCVMFLRARFAEELFPQFDGYSPGEDVHLSARIGRTHRLYFHATARYNHFPSDSPAKRDRRLLGQMRTRNQERIAREILGLRGVRLAGKMFLHRVFVTIYLLRSRPAGWSEELAGLWS